MKKLALKEEPRLVGELVSEIIEDAIAKSAGDMLRENLSSDAAKAKLKSYVDRWERLEEEKQALASDQGEVLKEADNDGFDKAALKTLLSWRKKGEEETKRTLELVAVYHDALGMDVLP
jgi:uncharacterized protein (UPF0335 family)